MNKSELVIELGAEGGSIRIYGVRTKWGWLFSRRVDDWTSELIGEDWITTNSGVVDSWEAVLGLLDQYPWHRFAPTSIHPEFEEQILNAVQQRLQGNQDAELMLQRWRNRLSSRQVDTSVM
jgi:hypothetical protein